MNLSEILNSCCGSDGQKLRFNDDLPKIKLKLQKFPWYVVPDKIQGL